MITIKLPCYGIIIKTKGECGTIESDLHYNLSEEPEVIEAVFEDMNDWDCYEAGINAIESLILSHVCAGVDVKSDEYIEGIKTTVEAIGN